MAQRMKAVCNQCSPSDPMGKAFDYAHKLWPRLGSCDVVGLEPLRWLTDVLGTLQGDTTPEQLKQLLPYYYKESRQ